MKMELSRNYETATNEKKTCLDPPFKKEHELQHRIPLFPPYHARSGFIPQCSVLETLELDLYTPSIDRIYSHLWLAGLPKAARPLHRQNLLGRAIAITENPNEHLISHEERIFVKPLPDYLLCYDFWTAQGSLSEDESLYKSACGFLLSYCWLICSRYDLAIAHETNLLSPSITWEMWVAFVTDILTNIDAATLSHVSIRYHYGELRLSRLNLIYRFSPRTLSVHSLVHGYMSMPLGSKTYLVRTFAWLLSVFWFVTIVTSAMQVGIGTNRLGESRLFQGVSVVFVVASMVAATASALLVVLVWVGLTIYHVFCAKRNLIAVQNTRAIKGNGKRQSV